MLTEFNFGSYWSNINPNLSEYESEIYDFFEYVSLSDEFVHDIR